MMLQNNGIRETIANTTDPAKIELLKQKINYVNAARGLLVALFAGISLLVYIAYLKRKKANTLPDAV